MDKTYLCLEDGETIEGEVFGHLGESSGEVVFSTAMTGYCQSLTDPSFAGQILVFTYPLIGNYGVPEPIMLAPHLAGNFESECIWTRGIVVSSDVETPSHYQMAQSFSEWLGSHRIPGIAHVDTRALTQKIREKGALRGCISPKKKFSWDEKVVTALVPKVSLPQIIEYAPKLAGARTNGKRILLLDCGVKHGILRELLARGFTVRRIPWDMDPMPYLKEVGGVVCSNGPGDPKDCTITIEHIRNVLNTNIPFLGVCLGHQLLALAVGADTYKLPYGHRGVNQPCQDVTTGHAYITSQNHGYAVDRKTIPKGFKEWFVNLNDQTNEGLRHAERKIWSTQFHPEGNPGPFDTNWIFELLQTPLKVRP